MLGLPNYIPLCRGEYIVSCTPKPPDIRLPNFRKLVVYRSSVTRRQKRGLGQAHGIYDPGSSGDTECLCMDLARVTHSKRQGSHNQSLGTVYETVRRPGVSSRVTKTSVLAADEGEWRGWRIELLFGGIIRRIFPRFRHLRHKSAQYFLLLSSAQGVAAFPFRPFRENATDVTLTLTTSSDLSNAEVIVTSFLFFVSFGITICLTAIAKNQNPEHQREMFGRVMLPINCVSLIVAFDADATVLIKLWCVVKYQNGTYDFWLTEL